MLILSLLLLEQADHVAFQGLTQDLIHEFGHGEFPLSGLVVEKASEITSNHGRIVDCLCHFSVVLDLI